MTGSKKRRLFTAAVRPVRSVVGQDEPRPSDPERRLWDSEKKEAARERDIARARTLLAHDEDARRELKRAVVEHKAGKRGNRSKRLRADDLVIYQEYQALARSPYGRRRKSTSLFIELGRRLGKTPEQIAQAVAKFRPRSK